MAARGPAGPLRAAGHRRRARGRPRPWPAGTTSGPRRPPGWASSRSSSTCAREPMPTTRRTPTRSPVPDWSTSPAATPSHLANTLRGTRVWAAIREAWRGGASLAGCSAGAMALGGYVPDFRHPKRGGTDGLGVVPDLRVLPHFDKYSRMIPDFALQAARHAGRRRRRHRRGHRTGVRGPVRGRAVGVPVTRSAVGVDDRGRPTAPGQRAAAAARRRVSQPTPRADLRQQGPPGRAAPGHPHLQAAPHAHHRAGGAARSSSRPAFVLDPAAPALDLAGIWGAGVPVVLEIGFGDGLATAAMAAADPATGILAIDVHTPGRRRPAGPHRRGGPHERAGHGGRRARRAQPHGPAALARRRAQLLPRPVAEGPSPQAPARAARRPRPRPHAARPRRHLAHRHGLGRVRRLDHGVLRGRRPMARRRRRPARRGGR